MALRSKLLYIIVFFSSFGIISCAKESPKGEMPNPMVAISFDDTYIDNWFEYLPLLDSCGIKATFYVSAYHKLTTDQKNKLRILEAHGNEIAYHTANHKDLVKLNKKLGMNAVIDREIKPDLTLMRNDGFDPISFAYPFGQHDKALDAELLRYFKSVRGVSNPNYYTCFARHTGKRQVFNSIEIDSRSKITNERIQYLMRLAWENNNCAFFYAHAINEPGKPYQVDAERLRFIAHVAGLFNIKFVTTADISN